MIKLAEEKVVQDLQAQIDVLEEKQLCEKAIVDQEIVAMNKAYQDKLISLKEKEVRLYIYLICLYQLGCKGV